MARVQGALSLLVGSLVACALAGCGGGGGASGSTFGPDPDFATLDARLSTPTGTLAAGTVEAAVSALDAVQSPSLSIDALVQVTPSNTSCQALGHRDASGTCACPNGGTFAYDFSELADGAPATGAVTLRLKLDRCAVGDRVLDGAEFAHREGGVTTARAAQLTVTRGAAAVDIAVWSAGAGLWARATGSDGAIIVGAPQESPRDGASRSVVVKDRSTTWTCTVTDAEERCSNPQGGERDGKA